MRIEDYAIIGDTQTAALVGADGSIDWLCLPRFDSGACFASLLGTPEHGRWSLTPSGGARRASRRYRDDSLILETELETAEGAVRIIDFMPIRGETPDVVRIVEGLRGRVAVTMELVIRFDYGSAVPWVRRIDGTLHAVAGPDALYLHTPVETHGEGLTTHAELSVAAGDRVPFVLTWQESHLPPPKVIDAEAALADTERWWQEWASHGRSSGPDRDLMVRSLVTLKALTYAPTGGLVAAATTSLPEDIGGSRNWDYRYCWLRDATFSLYALMLAGYDDEALAWRDWLLRAVAGAPSQLQIMYGPAGERRLTEIELDWLPGYEGSRPVRVGNAASGQFQLDVYGEVMDCLHQARRAGVPESETAWDLQLALMDFLEGSWRKDDEGIWEVRGPRRAFTHSKVMAWVAADRAVKAIDQFGLDGPRERWTALRTEIHEDVCAHGYDAERRTFTQSYGRPELDASLLMLPLVGFLPAHDERMVGTVAAIEEHLCASGFVMRYADDSRGEVDGLPGDEGAFLPCSFWLADNLILQGRVDEGRQLFDRLAGLANDVGLLAEEYDPRHGRMVGNFPQAFTHVALVNTANNLAEAMGPARSRAEQPGSSGP